MDKVEEKIRNILNGKIEQSCYDDGSDFDGVVDEIKSLIAQEVEKREKDITRVVCHQMIQAFLESKNMEDAFDKLKRRRDLLETYLNHKGEK